MYNNSMRRRTTGLRETWHRALREHGSRLVVLVGLLNKESTAQWHDHWNRLTPGVKGIDWKLPDWPNVFPVYVVYEPDRRTLPELINDTGKHLQTFMNSWFSAGQDYAKWQDSYPRLAATLNEAERCRQVRFQPAPSGGVQTVTEIETPAAQRTLYGAACTFADFLRNPFRDVLAGRCKRCERYFFNRKGYEQMVYCSQKCRWDAHNVEKELSRDQAQQRQQTTALSVMRKFLRTLERRSATNEPPKSWKDVIVKEVNTIHGTEFETKWLTRAINNPKGKYHKQLTRVQAAIEEALQPSAAPSWQQRGGIK